VLIAGADPAIDLMAEHAPGGEPACQGAKPAFGGGAKRRP